MVRRLCLDARFLFIYNSSTNFHLYYTRLLARDSHGLVYEKRVRRLNKCKNIFFRKINGIDVCLGNTHYVGEKAHTYQFVS